MSDLIDRQNAIDALKKIIFTHLFECGEYIGEDTREFSIMNAEKALDEIENIPSAEPERKKGKWVKEEHTYSGPTTYNYVCSACGALGGTWLRGLPKNLMYPFCPFCGADMRGEDGKA